MINYKLWWSGKQKACGGVGVLVKELHDKDAEIRTIIDRAMSLAIVFL